MTTWNAFVLRWYGLRLMLTVLLVIMLEAWIRSFD